MNTGIGLESPGDARRGRRGLLILALLAAALRVAVFLAVRPWDPDVLERVILTGDAYWYHDLAVRILNTSSFQHFGAFRTPGYPLFLVAVYKIAGAVPWAALLVQAVLGSLSVLLVHGWATLAVGRRAALPAAALFAFEPLSAFFTVTLLTETLFVFVFLAAMLAFLQGIEGRRLWSFAASGALLGVATLVRPIVQYFPVVAAGILLFHRGLRPSFRLKAAAAVVLVSLLALAPWLARNHAAYGHASLSSIQGDGLLFWSATSIEVTRTGRPIEEVRAEFRETAKQRGASEETGNPFENSRIYREIAMEYIGAHRTEYVVRHVMGAVGTFLNVGTKTVCDYLGVRSKQLPFDLFAAPGRIEMLRTFLRVRSPQEIAIAAALGLYGLVTYLAALWGAVALLRGRKFAPVLITVVIIAYFAAMIGTNGQPRYKLPLVPFYAALGGVGLVEFSDLVRRLRTRHARGRRALTGSRRTTRTA